MSESAATTVHEAYAFACMRCGHGWEQAYEIEHHVDGSGHAYVVYRADGERVPSPLSTPTCANCGGHVVRIMRSGRVSGAQALLRPAKGARPPGASGASGPSRTKGAEGREGQEAPGAPEAGGDGGAVPAAALAPASATHHWHLSDLLRPFHRG
ncbi:hypothetical protein STHAL_07070 [Streptomyces halstedii]|uniref:C2H2-type domain-containing protein n=1 Tax=Streptomyces halstedii TaxID=1944 RepID=A0ABS6TM02_STRHA|nr:hypothetical protein [Streptomyces halstedii]MBV7669250.1 hypothetical protein [Streptomyces halstedii]